MRRAPFIIADALTPFPVDVPSGDLVISESGGIFQLNELALQGQSLAQVDFDKLNVNPALKILAGSTAPPAATGEKYIFLNSQNSNALSSIDENGVVTIVDELIDAVYDDIEDLETNYPAADYQGLFAWVETIGLFRSNGSVWEKKADDSGDRTTLWDYGEGLNDGTVNLMLGGTAQVTRPDLVTPVNTFGVNGAPNAFDGSDASIVHISDSSITGGGYRPRLFNTMPAPKASRKMIFKNNASLDSNIVRVIGLLDASTEVQFTPTQVNTLVGTPATISGLDVVGLEADGVYEVFFDNADEHIAYGVMLEQTANMQVREVEFYELIDQSDTIDCVNSINKLHQGNVAVNETAYTADFDVPLDDYVIKIDTSSNTVTATIPDTVDTGKSYIFTLADATNNATIQFSGAEQALSAKYGTVSSFPLTKLGESVSIVKVSDASWSVTSLENGVQAEIFVTDNTTETSIASSNEWTKVTAGFTQGSIKGPISTVSSGIVPDVPLTLSVTASISIASAGTNQNIEFAFGVDDVIQEKTRQKSKFSNNDITSISVTGTFDVSAGATLSLFVKNLTSSSNVTVEFANVSAIG